MGKINNLKEMFEYLDTMNDPKEPEYDYCKEESYGLFDTYEKFLQKVLELDEVPKRVVDSRLVLVKMPWGHEVKNHVIKEPVYKDTKAIVRNPQIYTDGKKNYVPVEYWGK